MTSMSTVNTSPTGKPEGDISDTFASLSGRKAQPLPDRFRELKLRLVAGHEDAVIASWKRLLATLREENDLIARTGPAIIPSVRFSHLHEDLETLKPEIKKRGVAVIRGVISEDEARAYKFEIEEYVRQNPQTRAIHAVDRKHAGNSDSSVLYIPVCPTTKANAEYLARQRAAFLQGTPGPDFPGGEGESKHIGRATEKYVKKYCDPLGVQQMGLSKLAATEEDTPGGKSVLEQANAILGF
ncbi:hypothetical protein N0V88_007725 [Collariella sp. IMI 366227]|nr:hypothetical protein N0V88_007725 [Collariella sp. IMI 366227]